ncbi:MAG: glycosyltransferase family 4 protein, partial [Bradyrhizobium sp.]
MTGRQEMRKGADVLLDIIPKLLTRFPDVEFVLVGPGGPVAEFGGKSLVQALAAQIPAGSDWWRRVRFTGTIPDDELYRRYADADIFLFPSRYESFGLPVIEAMSFGLPVVAGKDGGIAEIVTGESGVLVDVDDRDAVLEAVGELIGDAQKRDRYGRAARARYVSHFSTAISVPRAITAYQAIVAERAGATQRTLPPPAESVLERMAGVIEQVTSCRGAAAISAARRLVGEPVSAIANPTVTVVVT